MGFIGRGYSSLLRAACDLQKIQKATEPGTDARGVLAFGQQYFDYLYSSLVENAYSDIEVRIFPPCIFGKT